MEKIRYVLDTTTVMSYFSSCFNIDNLISKEGNDIIFEAVELGEHIVFIPSIVFIEIFSKQFITPEIAAKIKSEVYDRIKNCDNISIESFDKEVLECFVKILDIEKKHNFDNHDKIIFATAMKYNANLITSDERLFKYNRRKTLIPSVIP